jgi:hypothetical protein
MRRAQVDQLVGLDAGAEEAYKTTNADTEASCIHFENAYLEERFATVAVMMNKNYLRRVSLDIRSSIES